MSKQMNTVKQAINNIRIVVDNARMTGSEHKELEQNINLIEELALDGLKKSKCKKKVDPEELNS